MDYLAQHGAQHHLESPHYIGENFDPNPFYHQQTEDLLENDNKQDIMFNLDTIDIQDPYENQKQLQCYQRLKNLYTEILSENDMPRNDLIEDDLF